MMVDSGNVDAQPERLVGERIAGRFIVERLIGHGPLSSAFRAHDDRLHRRVTVKLFHPRHRDDVQVVEAQLAAARSVARLSHEHVAMVIDRGEHEGMPLIVLEYVRGENLQERIDRFAPLAVAEVATYALQIARALAYAHGQGVVHGNLRPANVLLTEDREVKLVDFGGGSYVAQLVGDPYAAPELREVDAGTPPEPSDDIYALGAIMHVALTEHGPVPDADPGQIQLQRPDVSPRLAGCIARTLASDPQDRHASMRELAAELALARESMSSPSRGHRDATPVRGSSGGHDTHDMPRVAIDDERDDLDEDTEIDGASSAAHTAIVPRASAQRALSRRDQRASRTPNEARARILAWSMVIVPLVAVVIFGIMIAGERSAEQVGRGDATSEGTVERVGIAGAMTFDPRPKGDGEERGDLVGNAVDGNPDSTWQTEGYDRDDFNGLKPGVGVIVQLDDPTNVQDVAIVTDLPGWKVEVRIAEQPAATLDGWRKVSKITPVESGSKIAVDMAGATTTTYLLLWISSLSVDVDDPDRSRARIAEVEVYGIRSGSAGTAKATPTSE